MGAKAFHRIASRRTLALSAPAQPHNFKQAIIILWTIFLLAKVYLSPLSLSPHISSTDAFSNFFLHYRFLIQSASFFNPHSE